MPSYFHRPLSRRHILRGAGVALALPLLDAMQRRSWGASSNFKPWARSTAPQPRLICCYVPNGVNIMEWLPASAGRHYPLSPTLEALRAYRTDFTLLSGLSHPSSEGGHTGADTWLTAAHLKARPGSDYTNTMSIDQVVAERHGTQTRFSSLQFGDYSGTGGPGHSHTLSFDVTGTPLPSENSPRRVFERLFVPESADDRAATTRRYAERRSILDDVAAETRARKPTRSDRSQEAGRIPLECSPDREANRADEFLARKAEGDRQGNGFATCQQAA